MPVGRISRLQEVDSNLYRNKLCLDSLNSPWFTLATVAFLHDMFRQKQGWCSRMCVDGVEAAETTVSLIAGPTSTSNLLMTLRDEGVDVGAEELTNLFVSCLSTRGCCGCDAPPSWCQCLSKCMISGLADGCRRLKHKCLTFCSRSDWVCWLLAVVHC